MGFVRLMQLNHSPFSKCDFFPNENSLKTVIKVRKVSNDFDGEISSVFQLKTFPFIFLIFILTTC